jgi:hypothetical protein
LASLNHKSVGWRIYHFVMRITFRGIYFPQMGVRAWAKVIFDNRKTLYGLVRDSFGEWRAARTKRREAVRLARAE